MVVPERDHLLVDKHAAYVKRVSEDESSFEYHATEHFRASGVYWGLGALHLLRRPQVLDAADIKAWVLSCQKPSGAFGGSPRHDGHLLYTLSALQILALLDDLDAVDGDQIAEYVASLQQADGSFAGDEWREIDTRFSYVALYCLALLRRLDAVDVPAAVEYVRRCKNFDGGFGAVPGAESHSGQIFTCVAALSIAGAVDDVVDADLLGWWLAERQTPSGGLNGRPQKLQDVCYSWWCLSALAILGRLDWIDRDALTAFILSCQDEEGGGISDRADDAVDVYHTFFGIAGLSLLGYEGLDEIDPVYALPRHLVRRLGLPSQRLAAPGPEPEPAP